MEKEGKVALNTFFLKYFQKTAWLSLFYVQNENEIKQKIATIQPAKKIFKSELSYALMEISFLKISKQL